MPSQPQDSEKLTARIDRIIDRECPFADQALSNDERREMARVIAADLTIDYVDRYDRTPSVPGEDMRAKADEWLAWMGWAGSPFNAPQSLAALLSSTAALAREEAAQIADDKAAVRRALARKYADQPAISESNDRVADAHTACAAAIRAIGKEG